MPNTPPQIAAALNGKSILVLGAGMVGVCTALELQKRGAIVTLIDRKEPGQETSWGNAGMFARSSLVPFNNPSMWKSLPKIATNNTNGLRYNPSFLLRNLPWALRFIANARKNKALRSVQALNDLISLSITKHLEYIEVCKAHALLENKGWSFLYRDDASYKSHQFMRNMMQEKAIDFEVLTPQDLLDFEPALNPIFNRAVWIKDSYSVNNPGQLVSMYAQLFLDKGGRILTEQIQRVTETSEQCEVFLASHNTIKADACVICLGPWGKALLEQSGFHVTMGYERGYSRHFKPSTNLKRPICDTGGSYVMSPMQAGLRLSTGIELTDHNAVANESQIQRAEQAAREALSFGKALEKTPWLGARPTFPDSLPVIGKAPHSSRLYTAFGHQHIGFMTGPGTAHYIADIMAGKNVSDAHNIYNPSRYIKRKSHNRDLFYASMNAPLV